MVRLQSGILIFFPEEAVAHREYLDLRAHEAVERVLWCADDGFTPNVEACIYYHRAPGQLLELRNEGMVARVSLAVKILSW